jgi:hypothetical protein
LKALLNVSYDPTREFFAEYNALFARGWQERTGRAVQIQQSHGGSGKQARSVIDGLPADVVTLALAYDIDAIAARAGADPADWQQRLPDNSSPYTSTIVFLVRKGTRRASGTGTTWSNPGAGDHAQPEDLGRGALELPGRLGLRQTQGGGAKTHGPSRSSGPLQATCPCWTPARAVRPPPSPSAASAMCCSPGRTRRFLALKEFGADQLKVVTPSLSILAEPPVAVVDKSRRGGHPRSIAEAYLNGLYTEEGAGNRRPQLLPPALGRGRGAYADTFPKLKLVTIDEAFGGWATRSTNGTSRRRRLRPDLLSRHLSGNTSTGPGHWSPHRLPSWPPRKTNILPGFGLSLGITIFYLSVIVLIPLSAAFIKTGHRELARLLGNRSPRRGCWRPTA